MTARIDIEKVIFPMYGAAVKHALGDTNVHLRNEKKQLELKFKKFFESNRKAALEVIEYCHAFYSNKYKVKIKERRIDISEIKKSLVPLDKKEEKETSFTLNRSRWRRVRFDAFLVYGSYCACCGAKPKDAELTVDHIKSKSKHPHLAYDLRNLQILCFDCNQAKGNTNETDFRTSICRLKAIVAVKHPDTIKGSTK